MAPEKTDPPAPEAMLAEMAEAFRRKAPPDVSLSARIVVTGEPAAQAWRLRVAPGRPLVLEADSPTLGAEGLDAIFTLSTETLHRLYTGEWNAATAAAQSSPRDPAPLTVELGQGLSPTPEARARVYALVMHFFNRSEPERIALGEAHSRRVHGGHAVALYYHPGFRSAWYLVKPGERVGEPGDTNPFPQAFVIIDGSGFLRVGDRTIAVRAGESYYVPPGAEHAAWAGTETLTFIWLAWGEEA